MRTGGQGTSNTRLLTLLVLGCAASIVVALLGWVLGAAPLSAVEPNAQFIDCGAALFGRPDPLPHPDCAGAYFPLPFLSASLMLSGAVGAMACIHVAIRRRHWLLPQHGSRQAVGVR